jgi:flagellar hook-associated protein 1 FlgK
MTLVSSDMNMDQINSTLKNADILKLDQEIGIVNKLDVLDGIRNNPSNIAIDLGKFDYSTGEFEFTGPNNPSVWEELSNIKDTPLLNDGKDGFNGFLSNLIAEMGIRGETANKMHLNSKALNDQIDIERERVKGVSIDEEMSNMIKYQQAFNASARVVTAVDEMLNKVVNSLGIVGR